MKINIITLKDNKIIDMIDYSAELKRLHLINDRLYKEVSTELKKCLKVLDKLENEQYIDTFNMLFHDVTINGVPCKLYSLYWLDMVNYKGKYAIFYK